MAVFSRFSASFQDDRPESSGQSPKYHIGVSNEGRSSSIAFGLSNDCKGGKNIALRGGWDGTEAHLPNPPPPPTLVAMLGGGVRVGGALPAVPGGGSTPTYVAQNDPHIRLIILTTHMWGQHLSLHKTKGPARKPISGTPPPFLQRASAPRPPAPRRAMFKSPNGYSMRRLPHHGAMPWSILRQK